MKDDNVAIKVENLNKTFKVPTERKSSVKEYFLNPFSRPKTAVFKALKNVTFEIKKGEFVGAIGRNGSGKSTLLKIIAGIYAVDSGKVKVHGRIVPFLELGVGFNPELSGRENIFLNGTILGMSRKFLSENFDKIVDFAELREFIDLPLKNYSSGMQARLAFAIAIQTDADIYLLDEILSVGDASFQEKSLNVMMDLKRQGKTVIYVSHDLKSVEEHSDKVLLMDKGDLLAFGNSEEIVRKYDSLILQRQNVIDEVEERELPKCSVEAVKFLVNGKESTTYTMKPGDDIEFKIKLKSKDDLPENFAVGLGIYTTEGSYVLGVNTKRSGYKISRKSREVSVAFPKCPLLTNKYFINVALSDVSEKLPIEFKGQVLFFKSIASDEFRGSTLLEHKWTQQ